MGLFAFSSILADEANERAEHEKKVGAKSWSTQRPENRKLFPLKLVK